MLTHESQHQVLEVRDLGMARFIKMEPGKFYCYYKPSYANGFPTDPSGNPMQNKEALQILEGICRDELTVNPDALARLNPKLLITEQVTNAVFDQVFTSSNNVRFDFNPNMRAFKRNIRAKNGEKPILFVYQDAFMMTLTNSIFQEVLQDYQDIFDLYICEDQTPLKDTIYFKETHPQLPLIRIFDPAKRVPIEKIKAAKSLLAPKSEEGKESSAAKQAPPGDYPFTQEIMFMPHHHQNSKLKEQIE